MDRRNVISVPRIVSSAFLLFTSARLIVFCLEPNRRIGVFVIGVNVVVVFVVALHIVVVVVAAVVIAVVVVVVTTVDDIDVGVAVVVLVDTSSYDTESPTMRATYLIIVG